MADRCRERIREALRLARELTILADEGEADSTDDGCVVLYGVVRDAAYRIRAETLREPAGRSAPRAGLTHRRKIRRAIHAR